MSHPKGTSVGRISNFLLSHLKRYDGLFTSPSTLTYSDFLEKVPESAGLIRLWEKKLKGCVVVAYFFFLPINSSAYSSVFSVTDSPASIRANSAVLLFGGKEVIMV